MNLDAAKILQKKMPYKKIYKDNNFPFSGIYRLINPAELYEYKDETGKICKRHGVAKLIEIK